MGRTLDNIEGGQEPGLLNCVDIGRDVQRHVAQPDGENAASATYGGGQPAVSDSDGDENCVVTVKPAGAATRRSVVTFGGGCESAQGGPCGACTGCCGMQDLDPIGSDADDTCQRARQFEEE